MCVTEFLPPRSLFLQVTAIFIARTVSFTSYFISYFTTVETSREIARFQEPVLCFSCFFRPVPLPEEYMKQHNSRTNARKKASKNSPNSFLTSSSTGLFLYFRQFYFRSMERKFVILRIFCTGRCWMADGRCQLLYSSASFTMKFIAFRNGA